MAYLPESDGITHINVYSKGKTKLGKMLSNMYVSPTEIEFDGEILKFNTLEGFWYFLVLYRGTKIKFYDLCSLSGFEAKKLGNDYIEENNIDYENIVNKKSFKTTISEALKSKIRQNKELLSLLTLSELPFAHYYYYGSEKSPKLIDKPEHFWMLEVFNEVRKIMKEFIKNKEKK
jgi:hypothetical protein